MGMFGFLGGSKEAVKVVGDLGMQAAKGLDAIIFTDEEKAKHSEAIAAHKLKIADYQLELAKQTASENSIRSVTRRWLAWGIMGNSIGLTWVAVALYVIAIVQTKPVYGQAAIFVKDLLVSWGTITLAVAFFYFGYYGTSNVVEKFKK